MVMAVAAITASAQSKMYVGGGLGYFYNTDKETHQVSLAPEVGFYLSEKVDLGIALDYNYATSRGYHNISVNPYVRYDFVKFGSVSFFAEGGAEIGYSSADGSDVIWGIGIKPGVKVALTEKVHFIAHMGMLGYQDEPGNSGVGFSLSGNNLNFGLIFNL